MAFELPDLPYAHDALASKGMSAETLEYHHDLHHKAYVDNGNKLIAGTEWEGKSLEDIITGTYNKDAVAQNGIFNNISQLWNHNQFWEMMGPNGSAMPTELKRLWLNPSAPSTNSKKSSRRWRRPVRLRLGVAGERHRWWPQGDQDRERREPAVLRSDRASGL